MFWDLIVVVLFIISGALFMTSAIHDLKRNRALCFSLDAMSTIAIVLLMARFIFKSM